MPFSPVFKFAGKFYHFGQKKKKKKSSLENEIARNMA